MHLTISLMLVVLDAFYRNSALAQGLLQPPPEPPLELPSPTLPESFERPNIPGTITVARFEFDGNTAFSDEKLTEVTAKFTKRPLTFAELLQAEAVVTKLYTDPGYINSGAVIPSGQTLSKEGGVVKIQIIEGGVEEIGVTGTRRLNSNYVRRRLALATSKPLNQNRLLEALQLLQLDPLIQNISAELSAGERPELSLLEVRVTEADSFNTEFFADNGRAPSVGSFRRGVRINQEILQSIRVPFGLRMVLLQASKLSMRVMGVTLPLTPRSLKLRMVDKFSLPPVVLEMQARSLSMLMTVPPSHRSDPTFAKRRAEFGDNVENENSASGLFASTRDNSTGLGGDIAIATGQLIIRDGAEVSVSSKGKGAAGNLEVNARSIRLDNRGALRAETRTGAGNITLQSQDIILRRKSEIATNATGEASGGNIKVNTDVLAALENSDISANAYGGPGGIIDIRAQGIFGLEQLDLEELKTLLGTEDPNELNAANLLSSDITAISQTDPSLSGQVTINTPEVDPNRGLIELPENIVDPAALISQNPCARGSESEFTITGRGGLPPSPNDALSSEATGVGLVEPAPMESRGALEQGSS